MSRRDGCVPTLTHTDTQQTSQPVLHGEGKTKTRPPPASPGGATEHRGLVLSPCGN